MKKRYISFVILLALLSSYSTVFATDFADKSDLFEEVVELEDRLLVSLNTDEVVFTATVTPTGRMIAVMEDAGILKQFVFSVVSENIYEEINNSSLSAADLMTYCIEHESEACVNIYQIEEIVSASKTRGTGATYFTQQLNSIYGSPYSNKLLKTDTTTYPGYTMKVYAALTTSVHNFADYEFKKGMAALTIATFIADKAGVPYAKVLNQLLAAYGLFDAAKELFNTNGTVSAYLLTATQHRYVNVNGAGPYSEIIKLTEYLGLDYSNENVDASMQQTTVMYTPDNSVLFTDSTYNKLIKAAYENYTS